MIRFCRLLRKGLVGESLPSEAINLGFTRVTGRKVSTALAIFPMQLPWPSNLETRAMNSIAFLSLSVLALNGTAGTAPAKPAVHAHRQPESKAEEARSQLAWNDCDNGNDCGNCRHGRCGPLGVRRELLRPCGNLHPHLPYEAHPKTYYYFRPYSFLHVQQQQEEAMQWGADPRAPYSNAIFREVYDEIE